MAVEQGDVYFTVHRGPTSPKPHFCIVVNGLPPPPAAVAAKDLREIKISVK